MLLSPRTDDDRDRAEKTEAKKAQKALDKERALFRPDKRGETALHRAVVKRDAAEVSRLSTLPSCAVDARGGNRAFSL